MIEKIFPTILMTATAEIVKTIKPIYNFKAEE